MTRFYETDQLQGPTFGDKVYNILRKFKKSKRGTSKQVAKKAFKKLKNALRKSPENAEKLKDRLYKFVSKLEVKLPNKAKIFGRRMVRFFEKQEAQLRQPELVNLDSNSDKQ